MQLAHAHMYAKNWSSFLFCFFLANLFQSFHLAPFFPLPFLFICSYGIVDVIFIRKGEYFIWNEQKVNSEIGSGFFPQNVGRIGRIGQIWNDVPVQRAILAEFVVYQLIKWLNWKLNRFRKEIHCMHCFVQNENSQNSPQRIEYFAFMNLTHLKAGAQKKIVWGPERKNTCTSYVQKGHNSIAKCSYIVMECDTLNQQHVMQRYASP